MKHQKELPRPYFRYLFWGNVVQIIYILFSHQSESEKEGKEGSKREKIRKKKRF